MAKGSWLGEARAGDVAHWCNIKCQLVADGIRAKADSEVLAGIRALDDISAKLSWHQVRVDPEIAYMAGLDQPDAKYRLRAIVTRAYGEAERVAAVHSGYLRDLKAARDQWLPQMKRALAMLEESGFDALDAMDRWNGFHGRWDEFKEALSVHRNLIDWLNLFSGSQAEWSAANQVVAIAIRESVQGQKGWSGTVTELLVMLNAAIDEATRKSPRWPQNAEELRSRIEHISPLLPGVGMISIELAQSSDSTIVITRSAAAGGTDESARRRASPPDSPRGRPAEVPRLFLIVRLAEMFALSTGILPKFHFSGRSTWKRTLDAALDILGMNSTGLNDLLKQIGADYGHDIGQLAKRSQMEAVTLHQLRSCEMLDHYRLTSVRIQSDWLYQDSDIKWQMPRL